VFTTETPPAITDIPTLSDKILSLNTALKGSSLNYSDNFNTKYYCLGKLTLPQGGNHCYLKVIACYGFSVSADGTQNGLRANPSNYVIDIYIYSSDGTASIMLENWSAPNPQGCYHFGFAQSTSLYTRGIAVFICPDVTNPKNICEIWMASYRNTVNRLFLLLLLEMVVSIHLYRGLIISYPIPDTSR
jgi:succinate dehydrogenase hydrophobic anchor subunit